MGEMKGVAFVAESAGGTLTCPFIFLMYDWSTVLQVSSSWVSYVIDLSQMEWAGRTMCQRLGLSFQTFTFSFHLHSE